MITIEEYKNSLINVYWYRADNTDLKRKERREYLKNHYTDEYLNKIINDTYEFAKLVLKEDTIKWNYCEFSIDKPLINYIGLGLIGGHFADKLYYYDEYVISERILEYIFGKTLSVNLKEEEIEFDTEDEDIISFNYYFYLYLQGFSNVDIVKKELLGTSKVLK